MTLARVYNVPGRIQIGEMGRATVIFDEVRQTLLRDNSPPFAGKDNISFLGAGVSEETAQRFAPLVAERDYRMPDGQFKDGQPVVVDFDYNPNDGHIPATVAVIREDKFRPFVTHPAKP